MNDLEPNTLGEAYEAGYNAATSGEKFSDLIDQAKRSGAPLSGGILESMQAGYLGGISDLMAHQGDLAAGADKPHAA